VAEPGHPTERLEDLRNYGNVDCCMTRTKANVSERATNEVGMSKHTSVPKSYQTSEM
jgi:hypothetical protein